MIARTAFLIFALASLSVYSERVHVKHVAPQLTHSTYDTQVIPASSFGAASKDPKATALAFVSKTLGFSPRDYVVTSSYTTEDIGVTHIYLRQVYKGLEVSNAKININVDRNGNVISYGNSFFPSTKAQDIKPWFSSSSGFVTPSKAFSTLTSYLKLQAPTNIKEKSFSGLNGSTMYELDGIPFAKESVKAEQTYVQLSDSKLVPAWKFNLHMSDNWFDACVAADGSKVVLLNDWVSEYTYKGIPINKNSPLDGIVMIKDPEDKIVSPLGWMRENSSGSEFDSTKGNNVYAQQNADDSSDPISHARPKIVKGVYDYPIDLKKQPTEYTDAATVNLFYVCNEMHDIFYRYGFDEKSGNFQTNNFNKGGAGNDFVIANAQDGSGMNNANFESPPDGQHGTMRMYKFDTVNPQRDGDLDNGVIVHEYGHGISTRLTGGPADSSCLDTDEAGGMGEGWSDFFAVMLQLNSASDRKKPVVMGAYVINDPKGIRTYPYTTDTKINPTTYGYLNKGDWQEVHQIGEIWANILYQVYWNLFDVMGLPNLDTATVDMGKPNNFLLRILIDAMKFQPCSPTFVSARDAILKAAGIQSKNDSKITCAIWKAFALRGVGVKAKSVGSKITEDKSVPTNCK